MFDEHERTHKMANSEKCRKKTLVVGVGNPILSDDGVGIRVARLLKEMEIPNVDVEELSASGLELLDMVLGYDKVVIVDAIITEGGTPGTFYTMEESDFERTIHGASPHGVNVATALALGRRLAGDRMPSETSFIAIEVADIVNVSESLTPEVAAAVPSVVRKIITDLAKD
ncbi:MAG: hydrogenase maturation protease [Methanobacteriota archaeon]|nr:MAG: hydrogenase maturation protease [Euryarchaeota archaeon]